jgi:IclR family KDG regulon transcriptional repressor
MSHDARGPRKRQSSIAADAHALTIASISASESSVTPLPWLTRWTVTPCSAAASITAARGSGPSTDGISTRYAPPSENRAALEGGRQPAASPSPSSASATLANSPFSEISDTDPAPRTISGTDGPCRGRLTLGLEIVTRSRTAPAPAIAGRLVPALRRGLELLEAVGGSERAPSAADLAASLDLPRTTVHELLRTLVSLRYLEELPGAPRHYRLGIKPFELGNVYAAGLDLAREGHRAAQRIAEQCQETVHVAIRDGRDVIYVAKVDSTHPVRMVSATGRRLPAHVTAVGKMLLSAVPDEELEELYPDATLEPMTPDSITDREELRHVLAQVRRDGVAWDECESNAAVNCVAAPVFDHSADMVAAMSISVPTVRWSARQAARYAQLVRRGATDLSARLGYTHRHGDGR